MALTLIFAAALAAGAPADQAGGRGIPCRIDTGTCAPTKEQVAAVARIGDCVWRAMGPDVQKEMVDTTTSYGSRFLGGVIKRHPDLEARAAACPQETAADGRTFLLVALGKLNMETTLPALMAAGIDEAKLQQAWTDAPSAQPAIRTAAIMLADMRPDRASWDQPDLATLKALEPLFRQLGYEGAGSWAPASPQRLAFEYFVGREVQAIALERFAVPTPMLPPAPVVVQSPPPPPPPPKSRRETASGVTPQ